MADAPNLGASPFVISSRAFQGLTRNPSGDAPSFSDGTAQGQKGDRIE